MNSKKIKTGDVLYCIKTKNLNNIEVNTRGKYYNLSFCFELDKYYIVSFNENINSDKIFINMFSLDELNKHFIYGEKLIRKEKLKILNEKRR